MTRESTSGYFREKLGQEKGEMVGCVGGSGGGFVVAWRAGLRRDGGENANRSVSKIGERVISYGPKIWILKILNLIKQESAGHVDNCCLPCGHPY